MTKDQWGHQQTGRGYQGRRKLFRGKWNLGRLQKGGGVASGKQEGATTAFCRSPVCPAPSRGPKGSGRGHGGAEPGRYHSERRGGELGRREEPEVRTLLGAGGGRHTLGKRLGYMQSRPISKQSWGGVKGQLRPMGRKNTSEVLWKKREKRTPRNNNRIVWGLGKREMGVVYVMFQSALSFEGWGGLHHFSAVW